MIDITLYSPSEPLQFEFDPSHDGGNPSLFITHIEQGERNKVRLFLTMADLRTLRDLLNEKLPPAQFEELAKLKEENQDMAIERDLNT